MKYAQIRKYDISNWSGINSTIFFSGCTFNCEGCFNKKAQDFNYGNDYTLDVENTFIEFAKDIHVTGVCLLGGEVFQQDLDIILSLVKRIKEEVGKPIYVWTGYSWEELIKDSKKIEILKYITVLIDGKFEIKLKDLSLKHKGSTNQREIDVQKSLSSGRIELWD